MPRSALSRTAFTPDDPRSIPKRSSPDESGTTRRIDEPLDSLGVHFVPRVAISLQITANDAPVGVLKVLRDRRRLGPGVEEYGHRGIDGLSYVRHSPDVGF